MGKQNQTRNKNTNSGVHIALGWLKVRTVWTTNPQQNFRETLLFEHLSVEQSFTELLFIPCLLAVVKSICMKRDYMMRSTPVQVYPYYESLGTALYGSDRPAWKLPEPLTERLPHAIWKFLQLKKLSKGINDQMRPHFCSVDLENPEVKLRPLPSFLRQRGLTADQVSVWMGTALEAFRQLMSQYAAFECAVNGPAWKAAEKDIRLVVQEEVVLVVDASRQILTVAGRTDKIKQIRAPVEDIILRATSQIQRQTEGVSEGMMLSPAMFYILQKEGLQKATHSISPDMTLSYNEGNQKLTITGLPAEVFKTKSWILERNMAMSKKRISVPSGILDFLKTVDPMDMSQDLFTSHGITAVYTVEHSGVLLLGSSDSVLADAETKMTTALCLKTLEVEDQEVLKLDSWVGLNQQLLDTNNSTKKTVAIQIHPDRRDKITVAGFRNQVGEVSRSLKEFIVNYSRVQETLRVGSCAVVEFIDKKKTQDCSSIAIANNVRIQFDEERPRIIISGARLHVQRAKSSLQELTSSLFTDTLVVDKPGAKKYFLSFGRMFLSTIMMELNCMVVLHSDNQEEEDEDNFKEKAGLSHCKVQTAGGVLVSVSKADICRLAVDAVVNAANEKLQHIGGLALALLEAAGPELQTLSNKHVARSGELRPGEAIVTDGCNLPCKYVVHVVGPRFSDHDKKTSVSLLSRAVKQSLGQAESVNCSTIALPAVSSGVFGFPVDLCADTIAEAVREYCDSPGRTGRLTEIHLVDSKDSTVKVLAAAVNKAFIDLRPTLTEPQQAAGSSPGASG